MPVVVGLAAVVLALVALLAMYGTEAFGKMIAQLFPRNIGVGTLSLHPREWIEAAVAGVEAAIRWVVGDLIRPVIGFILRPVLAFLGYLQSLGNFALSAGQAIAWIITDGIPEALSAAKSYALRLMARVEAYAATLYRKALHYAHTLVHAARVYALSLYHRVEHYAARLVHAARAYSLALVGAAVHELHLSITAARHYAAGLVRASAAELGRVIARLEARVARVESTVVTGTAAAVAAGVKTAEAYANSLATELPGVLAVDIGHGIESVFDGLIEDVGVLEGVIGSDLPDIGAAIRAIPRAIPLDLAGELAIGLSVARVMTRYMSECGVPNCRNLSKVGRDLHDLFGLIEGGAFLAIIAEMVSNPEGAAREANDVLSPMASGLVGAARDLIGV